MKIKIAKRSASEYEDSLSSHDSCHQSIIAHIQSSSSIGDRYSCGSCVMVQNMCMTPQKNAGNSDKSLSLKKLKSYGINNWEDEKENKQDQNNLWHYQSEDSKIRKIQSNCSQLQRITINYKQYAKALKFEDEMDKFRNDSEKENEFMRINVQSSDSDEEIECIQKIRGKSKRKFGKLLYEKSAEEAKEVKEERPSNNLSSISQEDSYFYI